MATRDGRYQRRWKIERLFAWFHNSRRIVTRWERNPDNFLGMIHLASVVILLRGMMREVLETVRNVASVETRYPLLMEIPSARRLPATSHLVSLVHRPRT